MILSERGAIKAAICDGNYHIYPAAKLIEHIKSRLPGEDFRGDFNREKIIAKIRSVSIEGDSRTKAILKEDLDSLCTRLKKIDPEYDIESIFKKMEQSLPEMAMRYFGIRDYKPVKTEVIEYFFEGYNDVYKDADWNAFNVDEAESKEYNVPVGIYFKRSQVAPGYPEYVVMHENVHQFTAPASMDELTHYYVPWVMEGFADTFGFLMLYRATKDFELVRRTKKLALEFDVMDSRKATYHFESNIASLFTSSAGLPFTKAFLDIIARDRRNLDFTGIGNSLMAGVGAFDAVITGYTGDEREAFKKHLRTSEEEYKSAGDFNDDDRMMLRYFSSREAPSTLKPPEYRAAIWLVKELMENTGAHYVHTKLLDGKYGGELVKIGAIGEAAWKAVPKGHNSFLVLKDDIPPDLQEAAETLGNYFFIVKKEFSGKVYFDVYGGGLPYRVGTGEIRCRMHDTAGC